MDIGVSSSRRRGSAPKAGSVWESRMKIDQVKGGIKVFKATDENSEENTTPNSEIEIHTKQSPIGKRKTWKSESLDGSPVKIAALRSDLSRELSDGIKRSPIQIKKTSVRRVKDDDGNEGNLKREIKNCVVDDEREKKPRSEEAGASEEIKAVVTSNVAQINGGDELDLDEKEDKEIQVESRSVDVKEIVVHDQKPKRTVIDEKKLVVSNQKPVVKKQPPPAANHARLDPTPSKTTTNSDNSHRMPRTSSTLQSFVELIMWRDASKSAFVFGIGTFAIISSSHTRDLNISFISVLAYLGLVYLAAIFLFRSLTTRGSVDSANQDCVVGEEEAVWAIKLLLPFMNEFLLKLRALFSGDPATTMKLAVLLFVLARCGSSITIWTMAKLGFIGVFTVPKLCSTYSSQLTAYGTFWMRRFEEAWASCSHKKAVGFALFTLVWNLSSVVARIWAVFMLFVAFKHYQQSLIKEGWAQDEATNGEDSSCHGQTIGGSRLGRTTTIPNTEKQKKVC